MNKVDIYNTPYRLALSCTQFIRDNYFKDNENTLNILEPSAGSGNFVKAINKVFDNKNLFINEISTDYDKILRPLTNENNISIGDFNFYNQKVSTGFDLIIGNPPFSLWEVHVNKAMNLLKKGGKLAFLLRLNIMGSNPLIKDLGINRQTLLSNLNLINIHPIIPRPQFLDESNNILLNKHGKKGTDSTEYGLFVWSKEPKKMNSFKSVFWEKKKKIIIKSSLSLFHTLW
jgi:hypothetical protein